MLGIRGTYHAVRTANGPAQHIACAIWGVVMSGMFAGFVPHYILLLWAAASVAIVLCVVWLPRVWLKRTLLIDFVLSMIVLAKYVMYDAPATGPIYYTMTSTGMTRAVRAVAHDHSSVQTWAHSVAIVTLCLWSLYLANLVQRQILERQRVIRDDA